MITIYGRPDSSNCAKVFWLLEALNLAFDTIPTGGSHGGTDAPAYRALNPNGKVPTLVEDDLVLWESHAILRYLAGRHGPTPLYPHSLEARAQVEMWLDWIATTLNPAFGAVRRATSQATADAALPNAIAAFAVIDGQLARGPFIAGETLTLADIAIAPHVMRWYQIAYDVPTYFNLDDYHARLRREPCYRTHIEDRLDRS